MSNFMSGIFKKCKYGRYFIVYLIAFINLIGFGYCLTPDYTYNNVSNYGNPTNQAYGSDSIICFDSSSISSYNIGSFVISDSSYSPIFSLNSNNSFKFNGGSYCTLLFGSNDKFFINWFDESWSLSSINLYQYKLGGGSSCEPCQECETCDEAVCNLVIYDSFNMMSSNTQYGVSPGGIQDITFSYNSSNSSYSLGGSSSNPIYTFSPDSRLISCSSNLSTCNNQLNTLSGNYNTCLSDLSNCQLTPPNCSSCESDLLNCGTQLNTMSGNYNTCLGELDSCMAGAYNTGDLQRSALYINNIQHLGKPIIQIDIPEEIQRNYNSTGDYFDLTIDGYGYDEEKMLNMIDIQNYKPTSEEMSNLISKFADFVPLLGICLLFIAIRYIAKRIFKG